MQGSANWYTSSDHGGEHSLFADEAELARLKAADFALFGSSWWPQAGIEELRIVTFLAIWLFTWDDEIDEPTGFCTDDFKVAQAYRMETMAFVEHCLGLETSNVHPVATNPIIGSFRTIGERFCDAYNHGESWLGLRNYTANMQM